MKIIHLYSENIKRIKAVEVTPNSNTIIISGMNGHGKTSVLDSIWLALQYRAASKNNPTPLRSGASKGLIELDLGEYIVTRTFTDEGTTSLKITTSEGHQVSSPQKVLDGLIGDLSFDPWEFTRKKESEQKEWLCDLLFKISGGTINISEFDGKRLAVNAKKLDATKERARINNLMTSIKPPEASEASEEMDASRLIEDIDLSMKGLNSVNLSKDLIKSGKEKIASLQESIKNIQKDIDIWQAEIDACKITEEQVNELRGKLTNIQKLNERARQIKDWKKYKSAIQKFDDEIQSYKDDVELINIQKEEALESAKLPVDGIKIEEDGIKIKNKEGSWIPFCQMSAAQRLKISLSLAMKANPKMRIIRISDGSLLDDESIDIIKRAADSEDYQVWIEYTSKNKDDRYGVYIENGEVV